MATAFGLTWWGQRWIAALEALGAMYANRLPRGRTYARRGAVVDLQIAAGSVRARVHGSRARPYRVALQLPVFGDATWDRVLGELAGELRHSAALLDGQMPSDVDEVFARAGVTLFPQPGELTTSCSCPDWANPCKHIAALHYVLAQGFDADPFLLPALRGRERDRLLAGLRAVRSGTEVVDDPTPQRGPVPLAAVSAATLWDSGEDLAGIAVHPAPPMDTGAVLRRLGPAPGCTAADVADLESLVADAARVAWRLASWTTDGDDSLLAALRTRGTASTRELADELGVTTAAVRDALAAAMQAGEVRRTGHGRATRYEA